MAPVKKSPPANSFREAAEHLRRPFHPNAIKFKVQSNKGLVVAYIDARLVGERLNKVIPDKWETRFEPFPGGKQIICHLTVDGLTRSDVGSQATGDRVDPVKAGYSDAFKRAAVHFGVGVPIYAMRQVFLNVADGELDSNDRPTLKKESYRGKDIVKMTPQAERHLREQYAKWVKDGSGKKFGTVLDHGDEEGSMGGLVDESESEASEPVEAPSGEHKAAVKKLEQLYESVAPPRSPARRKLSVAKFKQQLAAAQESPEGLAELEKQITTLGEEKK